MSTRQKYARDGFKDVDSAWKHLKKVELDLICSPSLTKSQSKRRIKVIANRGKSAGNKIDRKYYRFLNTVDDAYKELCIIAFTRFQVDSTKKAVLADLAMRTSERRGDIHPSIRSSLMDLEKPETAWASQYFTPDSAGTSESCCELTHAELPSESCCELTHAELPSESCCELTHAELPSESWFEFTHAELQGTISTFGETMAKRVKNVEMGQDWKAVTMHFPRKTITPESPCFIKLEIGEEYLSELAMALFKIEVHWVANAFQVVHENGIEQSMPEFTHKGALEENVVAVFGPEISNASTQWTVRLAQGKSRIGGVSMKFARSEVTVTLEMSVQRGIAIQKKLYTKDAA